ATSKTAASNARCTRRSSTFARARPCVHPPRSTSRPTRSRPKAKTSSSPCDRPYRQPTGRNMNAVSSILVVGAGQAAAVAVATLRDQGYPGRITVVGDEAHAPYERPPLSKAVLAAVEAEEPGISVKEEDFFSSRDIDLRLGTEVVSLDPASGQAVLSDGSTVAYDRCLLATGGTARQLPGLSPDAPQVHYLRTLDDARRLRNALRKARSAVIIGAGFLGLEIAS